jgi:hypothetical protein
VDALIFYTGNMEVCVVTQPGGRYKTSNSPADVGERLFEPISGSGRNVIFGNWFTSCELSVKIMSDHILIIADTLRENKRQIPLKFLICGDEKRRRVYLSFKKMFVTVIHTCKRKEGITDLNIT